MTDPFKAGDRVIILDGSDNPGPQNFWAPHSMDRLIGREGAVYETAVNAGGDRMAYVTADGDEHEGSRTWWYYFKWLRPTSLPFNIDTFAEYLKTDV